MRHALLTLLLIVAGCTAPTSTTVEFEDKGYRVQLLNAGTVTLRNVRVTTGENVPPLTIGELAPGASSGRATVPVLHEHPYVSLTVNGRNATYHPVEGFGGFNAQVARGDYVIRLRYDAEHEIVDVRVEASNPNPG